MKFKIGDKVRILDGSKCEDYAGRWVASMEHYIGTISTVVGEHRLANGVILRGSGFCFDERYLELVESAEQQKEDEPKVEVNPRANKEHFTKVAAEVTEKEFGDLIKKMPELILLFAMFSSRLADALFDD